MVRRIVVDFVVYNRHGAVFVVFQRRLRDRQTGNQVQVVLIERRVRVHIRVVRHGVDRNVRILRRGRGIRVGRRVVVDLGYRDRHRPFAQRFPVGTVVFERVRPVVVFVRRVADLSVLDGDRPVRRIGQVGLRERDAKHFVPGVRVVFRVLVPVRVARQHVDQDRAVLRDFHALVVRHRRVVDLRHLDGHGGDVAYRIGEVTYRVGECNRAVVIGIWLNFDGFIIG